MNSTIKNTIMFVGIFLVIGLGYWFFSSRGNTDTATPGLSGSVQSSSDAFADQMNPNAGIQFGGTQTNSANADFLSALVNLNNIKLEDSVLSSPVLRLLSDFSITLKPEGEAGRVNPFAPIGSDAAGQSNFPDPSSQDLLFEDDEVTN